MHMALMLMHMRVDLSNAKEHACNISHGSMIIHMLHGRNDNMPFDCACRCDERPEAKHRSTGGGAKQGPGEGCEALKCECIVGYLIEIGVNICGPSIGPLVPPCHAGTVHAHG